MRTPDRIRAGLGAVLLVVPERSLRVRTSATTALVPRLVQVIGARYLVQAGVGTVVRRRWVVTTESAVELTHVASMVAIAGGSPRHRRQVASAVVATASAVADLRARRAVGRAPVGPR